MACYRVPRHLPVARPVSDALASTTTKRSWLFARCLLVCPGTTRQRPAPRGRNSRQSPHGTAQTGIESTYLIAEQRALNPRVRGSSPWRRTRPDLCFLPARCCPRYRVHGPGCSLAAHLSRACAPSRSGGAECCSAHVPQAGAAVIYRWAAVGAGRHAGGVNLDLDALAAADHSDGDAAGVMRC